MLVPKWDGKNRRAFRRFETRQPARLYAPPHELTGTLCDLGRGGAFFECDARLPVGSLAMLERDNDPSPVRVRVIWQRDPDGDGDGPGGLGIRFLSRVVTSGDLAGGTPPHGTASLPGALPEPGEDRRRLPRQRVDAHAELVVGSIRLPGVIRDVSQEGMFFETGARLELGELVEVRHPRLAVIAKLRVVRRGRVAGRRGLGLRLVATGDSLPRKLS